MASTQNVWHMRMRAVHGPPYGSHEHMYAAGSTFSSMCLFHARNLNVLEMPSEAAAKKLSWVSVGQASRRCAAVGQRRDSLEDSEDDGRGVATERDVRKEKEGG